MLITEGQLRRIIREELLREAAFDPYSLPAGITFRLVAEEASIVLHALKGPFEVGRIEAKKTTFMEGQCWNAYMIKWARSQIDGLGPLMYDIVMEAATELGGGLISDRATVKDPARNVWRYYQRFRSNNQDSRSDVERQQLDSLDDELTPGDEEDNCDATLAKDAVGDEWADYPLSGAYRKPGMKTIDLLDRRGKIELEGISV